MICQITLLYNQGRIHVCKGGRGKKISYFPIFFRRNFHFGTPKQFQWFHKKWQAKKKKKKKSFILISIPFPFHFRFRFYNFPSFALHFPFFLGSLSLSSSFPLSLPFSSYTPSKISPPKLSKGGMTHPPCPPLVTPLVYNGLILMLPRECSPWLVRQPQIWDKTMH